jgi:nitroimidazol reductase NimA-like FMN-containing flavoprotein (pyridoxamine 5'-phosphate oxidase superfamily)
MPGELDEIQINNLLTSQVVGRIACTDGGMPYIVPVTYVFDGQYIFGQTRKGKKLNILRKHPEVCFEVDSMTDLTNWQSVLVSGKFEELSGDEADYKRDYLFTRVMPIMTSSCVHCHQHKVTSEIEDHDRCKPVMFRINIREKSGRFEKK